MPEPSNQFNVADNDKPKGKRQTSIEKKSQAMKNQ